MVTKCQAWAKLVLLLLILSALVSSLRLLYYTSRLPKVPGKDEVTLLEKRLEELKKVLPPKGVVGYITDTEVNFSPPYSPEDVIRVKNHLLTQYSLAPVIVAKDQNHGLVVGVFENPKIDPDLFVNQGFRVVQNFGNGVVLFKKIR
ncbi:MAG: hypothetical protein V2A65_08095 [Candidatus Omnitrophota bacterium]